MDEEVLQIRFEQTLSQSDEQLKGWERERERGGGEGEKKNTIYCL